MRCEEAAMMNRISIALVPGLVLGALGLAACGGEVPSSPTYFDDVQPILRANCVRCHGAVPSDPKIARFRLDRYVKDDAATFDAWDYAQGSTAGEAPMIRVAVDLQAPAMPPDYELTDRQREILARWAQQGAPKGTRANRAPQIELVAPADPTTADQALDVSIRAWDDDDDGLIVQLWAHDAATSEGEDVPLGPAVGGGLHAISIDTGILASKHSFEIYAILDDGFADDPAQNRTRRAVIPRLAVDHGARGTAPRVTLVTPNGGETLIGTAPIAWTATDPDPGDTLAIELALIAVAADGTESVAAPIASGLPNTGAYAWEIPSTIAATDPAGKPILYKVRVTATDTLGMPPNTRSDSSDTPVSVARGTTTTFTWDDVKPVFVTYCGACHGEPARTVSLESFRLDKYDASDPEPPANGDPGVFETKGAVYQRMITQGNMPPASDPRPSQADRDMVASWILGGAPKGSGPTDPRPTFTWVLPSATQTGGSPVTLQWSAADAGGLASGRLEYAKVNGQPQTGCANAINPAWTAIPDPKASAVLAGAASWADSFAWTPPPTPSGYYCVRGSVTDTANQVTVVVNPFGIK
jgi:mono/diheme cytochrome c family protein